MPRIAPRLLLALATLALLAPAAARAAVSVNVDPALDRRPVSPLIYGVNYGDITDFGATPYTIRRWGGNATTRYSWTQDTHNSGSDWYYISTPSNHPNPALLPNGSEADLFVGETRGAGADVLMTVPLIGWSPKDRVKRWGFSVAKYGAQVATECTGSGGAPWCAADAGNGVKPDNIPVTGNDPADTSVPIGPSYVGDWITHLAGQFGNAAAGGVRYYDLDNEPGLWNSTHRDVHPAALTYDELWTRTLAYASELKLRDPGAKVLGPVSWGWCEYFWSPADGCGPGPDRTAHGGLDLVAWYLQQVESHRVATGTRLVDLLDIHYYPQAGTALNDDESASKAALRLRTLKSLYDPAYVDESWINQPVRLIPRMRAIIDARCPGTGLAITEYNFGGDTGISSALAQAEALAIFGREGVDLATRWVAPGVGTRCADAFRLYLDYDGAGGRVSGTSVRATSAKVDSVGAYAIQADDGRLFVLLFNKHTAGETAQLAVAAGGDRAIGLWRFTAGAGLASAGSWSLVSGAATLALPARSATLAVIASPLTAVDDAPPGMSLALRIAPNPSTGPATVEFTLPRLATATIALYDIAGRRVRRLAGGDYPAGTQRLAWDGLDDRGRAVPAGNYRVRIAALGCVESRSFVRLR
jgi:hypothetical protein